MRYLLIATGTILAMQTLVVILHELTHSTMAWSLDEMNNPLDIVWGNPITMTGWDEHVDYGRLFAQSRIVHAAIIGICPLAMHALFACAGISLMRGRWLQQRRWLFHAVYWFVAVNFMELIAYVYMRPFSGHGDIGNFNQGLGLSPWWVFLAGSALLTWGLALLYRHGLPGLQALFARDDPPTMWAMLVLTSFLLFFWGSGLRVVAYVPGPQRVFGFIGLPAFILTVIWFRPRHTGSKRMRP